MKHPLCWLGLFLLAIGVVYLMLFHFQFKFASDIIVAKHALPSPANSPPWNAQVKIVLRYLFRQVWFASVKTINSEFTASSDELNETRIPSTLQLDDSVVGKMAESASNVAANYWSQWNQCTDTERHGNVTYCEQVRLTSPFKVHHHNLYWQRLHLTNFPFEPINMFLYSAHYDDRIVTAPVVRLITTHRQGLLGHREWW